MPHAMRTLRRGWGFLVLACWCLTAIPAASQDARFATGVAITPKNFPAFTLGDVDDAFNVARGLGRHAVFITQWREFDINITRLLVMKARAAGLTPIVGLSPTTLDQGRKELDLPDAVRKAAGGKPSFANPDVRKAFIHAAEQLAELKPEYLCLATEINFLALQRMDEFVQFVSLYKEAYAAVKRKSPATKVFVSFQWEWMRIVDSKEMSRIKEHSKVISIFKPQLDVVGLTTYPSTFHENPSKLVPDYYSWVYNHIARADKVLLMEVGWPSAGSGSEAEQEAFIKRLPELLRGVNVTVVAWSLLHDVSIPQFDANLNSTGLLTTRGARKKAYEAFRALGR